VVFAAVGGGLLAGVGFGLLNPPMHTATSLVVLPPPPVSSADSSAGTHSIETQVLIASSEPVLRSAAQNVDPPLTAREVRDRVEVHALTRDVIEINAQGPSADGAMVLANAVAGIYLTYVTTEQNLPTDLGYETGPRVLEEASTAQGGNLAKHLGIVGLLGALLGGSLAAVGILAVARGDRRLRLRQEIADAVGIPVTASVSTFPAKDSRDWANLLERYTPTAVDAWSFRRMLHQLGLDGKGGRSLAVLSFAGDEKALPIGPQLAAFATSIGVSNSLEVETHDRSTGGALDGDPAESDSEPIGNAPGNGLASNDPHTDIALQIRIVVVDRDAPHLAGTRSTTATIVALAAGAVTAEELARLAVAAAGAGRMIDGLVVADPDPTDRTIGRIPQSIQRSNPKLPTLLTAAARKARK
jgi:capsular polysaccharide biosynthesis protein